jgi:hypothetical protein
VTSPIKLDDRVPTAVEWSIRDPRSHRRRVVSRERVLTMTDELMRMMQLGARVRCRVTYASSASVGAVSKPGAG